MMNNDGKKKKLNDIKEEEEDKKENKKDNERKAYLKRKKKEQSDNNTGRFHQLYDLPKHPAHLSQVVSSVEAMKHNFALIQRDIQKLVASIKTKPTDEQVKKVQKSTSHTKRNQIDNDTDSQYPILDVEQQQQVDNKKEERQSSPPISANIETIKRHVRWHPPQDDDEYFYHDDFDGDNATLIKRWKQRKEMDRRLANEDKDPKIAELQRMKTYQIWKNQQAEYAEDINYNGCIENPNGYTEDPDDEPEYKEQHRQYNEPPDNPFAEEDAKWNAEQIDDADRADQMAENAYNATENDPDALPNDYEQNIRDWNDGYMDDHVSNNNNNDPNTFSFLQQPERLYDEYGIRYPYPPPPLYIPPNNPGHHHNNPQNNRNHAPNNAQNRQDNHNNPELRQQNHYGNQRRN